MKISEQKIKEIIIEEMQNDEELQEIFGYDLKAGWEAGKQEFAYRRAVVQIKKVIKNQILPVFKSLLATREKLSKEDYDFPQVEAQFDKTLETVKKELAKVTPALPKEDQEATDLMAQINDIEGKMATFKPAKPAATQQQKQPSPTAAAAPAAAKRDDQQLDEFLGDIGKSLKQGKLAAKSSEYVKNLRASVDKIKPGLQNLRKLEPVLIKQKQAMDNPVAIAKQKQAQTPEQDSEKPLPSAPEDKSGFNIKDMAGKAIANTAGPAIKRGIDKLMGRGAESADSAQTSSQTQAPESPVTTATTPSASGGEVSVAGTSPESVSSTASGPEAGTPEATTSPPLQPDEEAPARTGSDTGNQGTQQPLSKEEFDARMQQLRSHPKVKAVAGSGDRRAIEAAKREAKVELGLTGDAQPGEYQGYLNTLRLQGKLEEKSKKPVSYNKLYENWRRFAKG